jgi:antitoxin (DNA-binding transcriptional repressor) of toxin-antitoxin stability system
MDEIITVTQMRRRRGYYWREAQQGRTFTLTRYGVPVGRIVPVEQSEARGARG